MKKHQEVLSFVVGSLASYGRGETTGLNYSMKMSLLFTKGGQQSGENDMTVHVVLMEVFDTLPLFEYCIFYM